MNNLIMHTPESVMWNIIDGLPAKGFNHMSGSKQFSVYAAFGRACEELATLRNELGRICDVNASAMAQLKLAIEDYDKALAENARLLSRVAELEGALRAAIASLENVDRHAGLLGGELANLNRARQVLNQTNAQPHE